MGRGWLGCQCWWLVALLLAASLGQRVEQGEASSVRHSDIPREGGGGPGSHEAFLKRLLCSVQAAEEDRIRCTDEGLRGDLMRASQEVLASRSWEEVSRTARVCFSLVASGSLDALECASKGALILSSVDGSEVVTDGSHGEQACSLALSAALAASRVHASVSTWLHLSWTLAECAGEGRARGWRLADALGAVRKARALCGGREWCGARVEKSVAEVDEFVLGAGVAGVGLVGLLAVQNADAQVAVEEAFGCRTLSVRVHEQKGLCPAWGQSRDEEWDVCPEDAPPLTAQKDRTQGFAIERGLLDLEEASMPSLHELLRYAGTVSGERDCQFPGMQQADCLQDGARSPVHAAFPQQQTDGKGLGGALRHFLRRSVRFLVVELNFGGLSNRRLSMASAAAAAKLLGRKLVLAHDFDTPLPTSFGPCFRCVRPVSHYYDAAALGEWVETVGYEELFEALEREPAPRVREVCRGVRCLHDAPQWVRDAQARSSSELRAFSLQRAADARNLVPLTPMEIFRRLGSAPEEVLWLDSGFRLLDLGAHTLLDANDLSQKSRDACVGCIQKCHSPEHNEIVRKEGWCDEECRRVCSRSCDEACAVSGHLLQEASRVPLRLLPQAFSSLLSHLRPSNHLDAAAAAVARTLSGGDAAFLCAHWRKGDWSYPLSVKMLVTSVKGALDVHNDSSSMTGPTITGIFLATDATLQERLEVSTQIPVLSPCDGDDFESKKYRHVLASMREEDWMDHEYDSVEAAILEQLVCARSHVFVGTRGSTFSEVIVHERIRRGWLPNTNYLVP